MATSFLLVVTTIVLIAVTLPRTEADDKSITANSVSVDLVGNSGKIKIYPSSDSNNFIMISQDKLEETDNTGNAVSGRSVNMASSLVNAGWSNPSTVVLPSGIVYTQTWFTATFPLGGNNVVFQLIAKLYQNDTTVQNGNTQVTVYRNSLKFDVNVTGWPAFGASTNTLNYGLDVSSKGGNNGATIVTKNNKKTVVFVNGLMDMPSTAVVDGVANTPITVTLDGKNNKQSVTFAFPAFTKGVQYDPVICQGCPSSSGSVGVRAAGTTVASAVALAFVAMFCVFNH